MLNPRSISLIMPHSVCLAFCSSFRGDAHLLAPYTRTVSSLSVLYFFSFSCSSILYLQTYQEQSAPKATRGLPRGPPAQMPWSSRMWHPSCSCSSAQAACTWKRKHGKKERAKERKKEKERKKKKSRQVRREERNTKETPRRDINVETFSLFRSFHFFVHCFLSFICQCLSLPPYFVAVLVCILSSSVSSLS